MAFDRKCRDCRHLKQTSKTQMFHLCRYWSSPSHGQGWTDAYVEKMCHRQPEAPACPFFEEPTKMGTL